MTPSRQRSFNDIPLDEVDIPRATRREIKKELRIFFDTQEAAKKNRSCFPACYSTPSICSRG